MQYPDEQVNWKSFKQVNLNDIHQVDAISGWTSELVRLAVGESQNVVGPVRQATNPGFVVLRLNQEIIWLNIFI